MENHCFVVGDVYLCEMATTGFNSNGDQMIVHKGEISMFLGEIKNPYEVETELKWFNLTTRTLHFHITSLYYKSVYKKLNK